MYGVSSGLIQALQYLYWGSGACVKINWTCTDWFDIRSVVRQGYVASSWLFNLLVDSCLYDLKEYNCGLKTDKLSVKCLFYADDQVILAPSACGLQEMVVCFRCLSSTRTYRPMEWKRDSVTSRTLRPIVPLYHLFRALVCLAQAERDNESCFFVRATGVHQFIRRYHVKGI
ncbi:hypothetical protein EVAR_86552_1 [Eumeta japonica]|uniref:Reverse transcriptase domain-containing protein n=1 Tax=Eumeta variegata TaxID=151549 RepID=A0A4C1ZLU9_EUMVA|nr:hypothetical protein EVAR_86552_1 [Eumeta japonica]